MMFVATLAQAYTQLWLMLGGEILTPKRALLRLERYFSVADLSRDFVVLLVDELDYMVRDARILSPYGVAAHGPRLADMSCMGSAGSTGSAGRYIRANIFSRERQRVPILYPS